WTMRVPPRPVPEGYRSRGFGRGGTRGLTRTERPQAGDAGAIRGREAGAEGREAGPRGDAERADAPQERRAAARQAAASRAARAATTHAGRAGAVRSTLLLPVWRVINSPHFHEQKDNSSGNSNAAPRADRRGPPGLRCRCSAA